jgi:hypothetical protein
LKRKLGCWIFLFIVFSGLSASIRVGIKLSPRSKLFYYPFTYAHSRLYHRLDKMVRLCRTILSIILTFVLLDV